MAKPIFIVRLPNQRTNSEVRDIKDNILRHEVAKEYHILVLRDEFNDGDVKFECYNSPHTEKEFKALQDEVLKSIQQ